MTSKTSKDRPETPAQRRVRPRSCASTAPSPAPTASTASPTTAGASGPPPGPSWSPSIPQSGELTRTLDRACDAGTAFDGTYLYQIAEARIDKIDPATGEVVASIPAPGNGSDSGLTWAEGSLWVGQYRDRKIHQIDPGDRRDPAHHRVQPLRHRRDLGRRRAVARHLGRGRERDPPDRPGERRRARAAGDAARHRRQRARVRRRGSLLLRRRRERKGPRRAPSESIQILITRSTS